MNNTQDINRIMLMKELRGYCPLGEQEYMASVSVEIRPLDSVPDFLDLDAELSSLKDASMIIEELTAEVYCICKRAFGNAPIKVSISVPQSKHFPVIVEKGDF